MKAKVLNSSIKLPIFTEAVKAGFPSPADDFVENKLSLDELLVQHPTSTFFLRASGDSMKDVGIHTGDILVVDRSLEPADGSIVIAAVDGELTVKRLKKSNGKVYLIPENPSYKPILVKEDSELILWGVVTVVIHKF